MTGDNVDVDGVDVESFFSSLEMEWLCADLSEDDDSKAKDGKTTDSKYDQTVRNLSRELGVAESMLRHYIPYVDGTVSHFPCFECDHGRIEYEKFLEREERLKVAKVERDKADKEEAVNSSLNPESEKTDGCETEKVESSEHGTDNDEKHDEQNKDGLEDEKGVTPTHKGLKNQPGFKNQTGLKNQPVRSVKELFPGDQITKEVINLGRHLYVAGTVPYSEKSMLPNVLLTRTHPRKQKLAIASRLGAWHPFSTGEGKWGVRKIGRKNESESSSRNDERSQEASRGNTNSYQGFHIEIVEDKIAQEIEENNGSENRENCTADKLLLSDLTIIVVAPISPGDQLVFFPSGTFRQPEEDGLIVGEFEAWEIQELKDRKKNPNFSPKLCNPLLYTRNLNRNAVPLAMQAMTVLADSSTVESTNGVAPLEPITISVEEMQKRYDSTFEVERVRPEIILRHLDWAKTAAEFGRVFKLDVESGYYAGGEMLNFNSDGIMNSTRGDRNQSIQVEKSIQEEDESIFQMRKILFEITELYKKLIASEKFNRDEKMGNNNDELSNAYIGAIANSDVYVSLPKKLIILQTVYEKLNQRKTDLIHRFPHWIGNLACDVYKLLIQNTSPCGDLYDLPSSLLISKGGNFSSNGGYDAKDCGGYGGGYNNSSSSAEKQRNFAKIRYEANRFLYGEYSIITQDVKGFVCRPHTRHQLMQEQLIIDRNNCMTERNVRMIQGGEGFAEV